MSIASPPPPTTRVSRTPPQVDAPRLLLLGEQPVVLGAATVTVGATSHPVEQPKGLGVVDGRVVVLDAPASAPGRVRVRRVDAEGRVSETPPGSVVVPFAGRAFVFPGVGEHDLVVVSWEARGAISRITTGRDGLVPEGFTAFAPTGPPLLAAGPDRSWVRLQAGSWIRRAPDGREQTVAWPAEVPRHLAWIGGTRWAASSADGTVAVVSWAGEVTRSPAAGASVHHLAAEGDTVVALLLDEDPTVQRRELWLARLDLSGPSPAWGWRVRVSPGGPPADCWVAVGGGAVALGGSWGAQRFDAATGEPRS